MLGFKSRVEKSLEDVLAWIGSIAGPEDVITVERKGGKDYFRFTFPSRVGDLPRRIPAGDADKESFLIQLSASLLAKIEYPAVSEWRCLFSSPRLAVWESKSRLHTLVPLRFGLSEGERSQLARIARQSVNMHLIEGKILKIKSEEVSPRLNLKTDLNVALWVGGALRGSVVLEQMPILEGIAKAAELSCADTRFKPVSESELEALSIEISIMRDLRISLTAEEKKANRIYCDKGYVCVSNGKKGYFLPEVFNATKFSNLQHFLGALLREKTKVEDPLASTQVRVFEVESFISLSKNASPRVLRGPVLKKTEAMVIPRMCLEIGHAAARWLVRTQESDGNIPPIVPVSHDLSLRVDWPRLAFTSWALAEFGVVTGVHEYTQAAKKSLEYLQKYQAQKKFAPACTLLTRAYTGQLAHVLGEQVLFQEMHESVTGEVIDSSLDTITLAQIASLLAHARGEDSEQIHAHISKILRERFLRAQQSKEGIDLATYAELVNVFKDTDSEFSKSIAGWLVSMQLHTGAFPQSNQSLFEYTRGTGKIFEVLALHRGLYETSIQRSVQWLESMQYDDENLFFVPQKRRDRLVGGFRHDYQNTDTWIDAAGHVLVGASRMNIEKKHG